MDIPTQDYHRRLEEFEALQAIFGDLIFVSGNIDSGGTSCSIALKSETDRRDRELTLLLTLPEDYPTLSPPTFDISCPHLSAAQKTELSSRFEEIYADNLGEPVLYHWIECSRAFLQSTFRGVDGGISTQCSPKDRKGIISSTDDFPLPLRPNIEVCLVNALNIDNSDYDAGKKCSSEAGSSQEYNKDDVLSSTPNSSVDEMVVPTIYSGQPLNDRKSTFQGHVAAVNLLEQVSLVMTTLKSNNKIARATHNIYAYRFFAAAAGAPLPTKCTNGDMAAETTLKYMDCEDDGETGAGAKLLHLMEILDVRNVLVVVTRWYGGIHLGPDRFKHICNVAREMLVQQGFVDSVGGGGSAVAPKKPQMEATTSNRRKRTKR